MVNIPYRRNSAKTAGVNTTPYWNVTPVSSTSYFMTIATEIGAIGLLFYVLIVLRAIQARIKTAFTKDRDAFFFAFIALCVVFFFLPVTLIGLYLFFVLLALSMVGKKHTTILLTNTAADPGQKTLNPVIYTYFLIGITILSGLLIYLRGQVFVADIYLRRAVDMTNKGRLADALLLSEKSIVTYPNSAESYTLASMLSYDIALSLVQKQQAEATPSTQMVEEPAQDPSQEAADPIEEAEAEANTPDVSQPTETRDSEATSTASAQLSDKKIAQTETDQLQDQINSLIQKSIAYARQATLLIPSNPIYWGRLATLYSQVTPPDNQDALQQTFQTYNQYIVRVPME